MAEEMETHPLLMKEKKTWAGFFLKAAFIVGALVLVIITVLANMGGSSDNLKTMVEQFASEITGTTAKIKKLNNVTFFPRVSFDFEDMDFFREPESKMSSGHIDRAEISFDFWDIIFSRGRVKNINIVNLSAAAGSILAKPVLIKSIEITDTGPSAAVIGARGTIGPESVSFSMGMQSWGEGRSQKYGFSERRDLSMAFGDVTLSAILQNDRDQKIRFENLKIATGEGTVVSGRIDISKRRVHEMMIGGELTVEKNKTILRPDLIFDLQTKKLSGSIASDHFDARDFDPGSAFAALIGRLVAILGDPAKDSEILDEFFAAHSVTLDAKGGHAYQGPLVFVHNRLSLKPPAP